MTPACSPGHTPSILSDRVPQPSLRTQQAFERKTQDGLFPRGDRRSKALVDAPKPLETRDDKTKAQLESGCPHLGKCLHAVRADTRFLAYFPVELEKLIPARARLTSLWGGIDVMATEDVAYGDFVDGVPQGRQRALETAVAPGHILLCHQIGRAHV